MNDSIKDFLKGLPKLEKTAKKEFERIIAIIGEDDVNAKDLSVL